VAQEAIQSGPIHTRRIRGAPRTESATFNLAKSGSCPTHYADCADSGIRKSCTQDRLGRELPGCISCARLHIFVGELEVRGAPRPRHEIFGEHHHNRLDSGNRKRLSDWIGANRLLVNAREENHA
jgi:hypothetical protein